MPAHDTVTQLLQLDPRANEPLVQQIQRLLRAAIDDGKLPIGERLPSMRQIADDTGVSLGIVKQALNTLTAEGYLQSSPRRGVFVGKPPSNVRDVALVLPMLTNEQMVRVANGVRRGLAGTSLRLVIQAADADYDAELHLLKLLDPSLVAGTIVFPPGITADVEPLRKLRDRGIPAVQVVYAMDEDETGRSR
ncbi:MAG: GntR family transcriptional regulator, partial [Planctomycetota bacterium]